MKVILLKKVTSLGEEDSILEVSDGYARNYLLPQKLATLATPSVLASAEKRKQKKLEELEKQKAEFLALKDRLSSLTIEISAPAGEEGKLFGSVTSQDIAEAVKNQAGIELDKKKIELEEPLKLVGEYNITVGLFQDIKATLKIKVKA